jgi:RNA recognition motif-containing protein
MSNRLYVENLPPGASESSLRELFSTVGTITEVKLVMDAATGISRGRAFVSMATAESAEKAVKTLHSHNFGGRNIAVTLARPVEEHPTGLIGQGFESGIGDGQRLKTAQNGHQKSGHRRRPPPKRKKRRSTPHDSYCNL